MQQDILSTYYKGILQRLRAEVELLNQMIPHNVTKGTANENALRELIRRFVPRRYSVGSGIIIDTSGNQSRQVDIIIYDEHVYPSVFGQTSACLYPIEVVIATIEVKTTLTDEELQTTSNNVESIRQLRHYEGFDRIEIHQKAVKHRRWDNPKPTTFLFAYRGDSNNPATWRKRFEAIEQSGRPDVSILLDLASLFFADGTHDVFKCVTSVLYESDISPDGDPNSVVLVDKPQSPFAIGSTLYRPSPCKLCKGYPVLAPEKSLLYFLARLNAELHMKPKHEHFAMERYLSSSVAKLIEIPLS
ncbi:MAG: DUF6602 domain-containing protein [Candidatus Poribacteria bacterium]